ncbi:MAG: bifunctional aspartate kinase/diaminopimelate decarboxylase [Lysobacterales bacterium]
MPTEPFSPTAAPRSYVVLKFGGTSVASAERWRQIAELAAERRAEGFCPVIVVSALAGVTNLLLSITEPDSDRAQASAIAATIGQRHRDLAAALGIAWPATSDAWLGRLDQLLADPRAEQRELPWQAELLSIGELLSSSLGARWLEHCGLATGWLDSREWLTALPIAHASAWARWLSVSCDTRTQRARIDQCARDQHCLIAPGFIAADPDGRTVLLGRGGSDTSAACFGALFEAERVEIWTDVAGMFSADPRRVPNARLLARLDFEEATEIATTGAKVLHPRALAPLREAGVPMWIKDTGRPELAGTVISARGAEAAATVKALSMRRGITLIAMESVGMWQQVGFLADVFAEFKRHGLSVDLIGSAETNVTVSLDPTENLVNSNVLEALCGDLARVCRVKVIGPCAAITLVGRGMRGMLPRLSGVWAEFGALPVHLISQSANDLNLTFVVDEARSEGLIERLHEGLIGTQALRIDDQRVFGPSYRRLYQTPEQAAPPPWWRTRREALLALAAERTPRYVYERATIAERARALRAIGAVDRWFYAIKANAHPGLLRLIADQGFGLECVSVGELAQARAVAADAPLLYTSNFAPSAELASVVASDAFLTLDNGELLEQHGALFRGRELLLRIDPGYGRGHHDKVKTGGANSKFGIALADLPAAMRAAERAGARVIGLHAHAGSGILAVAHFREVYAELAALADTLPGIAILNIGGGLGVPTRADDQALDLAELALALAEVKAAYPHYALWMEPGRYLVAEAGVLLARVTQTKRKGAVQFLGVDAGMHNLLRPALYDAWHPIVNLSRLDQPAVGVVQVVGPICESGDVLGRDRALPESAEGDVILIGQAGAYGAVMASHYNRRAAADEVLL